MNKYYIVYTNTSFSTNQFCPNVFLKSSTLFCSPLALLILSLSFTHETRVPSGLFTLFGLITTQKDQKGQNGSGVLGNVFFVLLERFVQIPKRSLESL
jgi:hypothetical protein